MKGGAAAPMPLGRARLRAPGDPRRVGAFHSRRAARRDRLRGRLRGLRAPRPRRRSVCGAAGQTERRSLLADTTARLFAQGLRRGPGRPQAALQAAACLCDSRSTFPPQAQTFTWEMARPARRILQSAQAGGSESCGAPYAEAAALMNLGDVGMKMCDDDAESFMKKMMKDAFMVVYYAGPTNWGNALSCGPFFGAMTEMCDAIDRGLQTGALPGPRDPMYDCGCRAIRAGRVMAVPTLFLCGFASFFSGRRLEAAFSREF